MNLPTAANLFERLPRVLRRHRLMRLWMALTGENPVQLVRIRDDAFGYADMSDGFLRLIVIEGNFESDFFRVADSFLETGGVFLDVGANYGLLSFGLARKFGTRVRFHLFEPNPKLRESIARTLVLYPSIAIKVNPEAVCNQDGSVHFHIQEDQSGASHIVESEGISILSQKLDTYLANNQIDGVDLLKIDIEGHELAALRGAGSALRDRRIKAVYFEYFEKWLSRVQPPRHLLDYLDSVSYEVLFCRATDIAAQGRPTHTLRDGLPGRGLPLLPVRGCKIPSMTDLLAVPRENLTGL